MRMAGDVGCVIAEVKRIIVEPNTPLPSASHLCKETRGLQHATAPAGAEAL